MFFTRNRALTLKRSKKIAAQIILDGALLLISFLGAVLLKFESVDIAIQPAILGSSLFSIIAAMLSFWLLGLYQVVLRFITARILFKVLGGALVAMLSLYSAASAFNVSLPWPVPAIYAILIVILVGGMRFAIRTHFRNECRFKRQRVIIYGAGGAGLQLVNSLFHSDEYDPIAFVDENPKIQNLSLAGLKVYPPEIISQLVRDTDVKVIFLAIPSLSRARRREILMALGDLKLEVKTIPSMSDLISGKAKISELQKVSAEDLLGRDPVAPDAELLGRNITGRAVMVSGAGGSIGSELCRQILEQNPSVLVLYELSEFALYTIEAELSATTMRLQLQTRVVPILGSVQNELRLEATIKAYKVQTIYHAAAYKHVPLVEENVVEGIRNNVFGTLAITLAARKLRVENFILISTDKAVRPTNVMGATKRISELICQAHAREGASTCFSMVRFGNVLGSSGSVIPLFRAQIEAGGPITVTHKDINRYFMTIPEAAQLVIQAGALGQGGDVFVLDMGTPVRIMDLAFSMVKLHGLIPYTVDHPDQISPEKGDIPILVTGLRKGEKLYEELLIGNNASPSKHPRIMTASEISLPRDALMPVLDRLLQACERFDLPEIVAILNELPLEYAPSSTQTSDLLWWSEQSANGHRT